MVRTHTSDSVDTARQGSLSLTLEMWTSTVGTPTERMASPMAREV